MDDVSESTRQSLESLEPVQTIPRRSASRSRRKRGSNFVEKQEIAAQMRQKDRDDARDAADAAMVAEIKRLEATPCYFMAPMRKTPTERAMEQLEKERKEALAADY